MTTVETGLEPVETQGPVGSRRLVGTRTVSTGSDDAVEVVPREKTP